MKIALPIFLLLFLLQKKDAFSQDSSFKFSRELPVKASYFTTNLAGELFVINADNQLIKYNSNGDSVGVFNDVKKYGKLSFVQAQNSWKTLLFYQNFQTIVLLDKYLKNIGSINLQARNYFNVSAVTTSYDNNIWLFDGREFKIKKIDDNGNTLMASVDLRQLFDESPSPVWMADNDGFLYLYDPSKGVYVFDYYGAFKTLLRFKNWKSLFVIKKDLVGFDERFMYKYTPPLPLPTQIRLPEAMQNADQISLSSGEIYILKQNRLSVFQWR